MPSDHAFTIFAGREVLGLKQDPIGETLARTGEHPSRSTAKPGDLRGFWKRLMGLEPTTFCMASRT
jgi:hypothetical protein